MFAVASKIKISDAPEKPKATFLRKSAFLTTGDETFRFNFKLAPEQVDSGNTVVKDGNTSESIQTDTSSNKVSTEVVNTEKGSEGSAMNFKFTFTKSDFKFNFNVDNS